MKLRVGAIALVLAATWILACGEAALPNAEAPAPTSAGVDAGSASLALATPTPGSARDLGDAGSTSGQMDGAVAAGAASASGVVSYPPAKPTTLPLGHRTLDDRYQVPLLQGDQATEREDYAAARSAYLEAKKANPAGSEWRIGLARVRMLKVDAPMDYGASKGNKEITAAAAELRAVVKMDESARKPEIAGVANVELGRALLLLGDAPNAILALRKGVELLPDEAESHSALGVALLATGKGEESLGEMQKAVTLDPGSASRHGNLGTVFFMRGRVPDAVREYRAQVQLNDSDPRAHADLGTALLAQSDFAGALPELLRAIALDPKRATFKSNLGYALQLQGKTTEAIAQYREAIRLDPTLTSAYINLATALAHDPKTRDEARAALKKAGQLDPGDPRVKANLDELDALK